MLMLSTTTMRASVAAVFTKMTVITLLAPLTTQARILIAPNCDNILCKAGRTGLAENSPFDSGASLGIDPRRANQAHEPAWVVGFAVQGHVTKGKARSARFSYPGCVECGAQVPFAGCHHLEHFPHRPVEFDACGDCLATIDEGVSFSFRGVCCRVWLCDGVLPRDDLEAAEGV